jgi:hypothetical protein
MTESVRVLTDGFRVSKKSYESLFDKSFSHFWLFVLILRTRTRCVLLTLYSSSHNL